MARFDTLRRAAALAVAVGLVTPSHLSFAAGSMGANSTNPPEPRVAPIADVALENDGALLGQAVTAQGQPVAGATVLLDNGREQASTTTDARGRFRFADVRGGAYRVRTNQQTKLCRVWKAGTAPPAANKGVLIVDGKQAVLGQYCSSPVGCGSPVRAGWDGAKEVFKNPLVIGGVIAAAIAIPVALHNSDDDDPASP